MLSALGKPGIAGVEKSASSITEESVRMKEVPVWLGKAAFHSLCTTGGTLFYIIFVDKVNGVLLYSSKYRLWNCLQFVSRFDQLLEHTTVAPDYLVLFLFHSQQYEVVLSDLNQPMLVSRLKNKQKDSIEPRIVHLIPELCYLTGKQHVIYKSYTIQQPTEVI